MIDDRSYAEDDARAPSPRPDRAEQRRTIDVADVAAALRRRALPIAAITVAMGVAGFFSGSVLRPRYISTAQIYIDPRTLQVVDNDITAKTIDSNAFTNLVESQALIVVSDGVMRPVVMKDSLYADPEYAGGLAVSADPAAKPTEAALELAVQASISELKKQTAVDRPERTSVLDISVASRDPAKAARLANDIAQSYLDVEATRRTELAQRTTTLLTDRLSALRQRVNAAETKIETFKAQNNLVGTAKSLVTDSQLDDANTQIDGARARVADAQARYDQILAARRSPELLDTLPEAVTSTAIANLRLQYTEARRQLAGLSAALGDLHPSVRMARAQVDDVRKAITAEIDRIAASARADLDRARAAQTSTAQSFNNLKGQVVDAGQASVELRQLQREADADRDVYQTFLVRSRETNELGSLDSTNASIVTEATAPAVPVFPPRRSLLAALGAMFGLALGIGLALFIDVVRPRLRSSEAPAAPESANVEEAAVSAAPVSQLRSGPDGAPVATLLPPGPTAVQNRNQNIGALDLTKIGIPTFRPADTSHLAFLRQVLDGLDHDDPALQTRSIIVIGCNEALERTALALNLALEARARGLAVALMDYDPVARPLTKAVIGALGFGRASPLPLFNRTQNGIGLILFPRNTPLAHIDPVAVRGTLSDETIACDLLICDGPSDLAGLDTGIASAADDNRLLIVTSPESIGEGSVSHSPIFNKILPKITGIVAFSRLPISPSTAQIRSMESNVNVRERIEPAYR